MGREKNRQRAEKTRQETEVIRDEGIERDMLRCEHRSQREVNREMEVGREAEAGKSEGVFYASLQRNEMLDWCARRFSPSRQGC